MEKIYRVRVNDGYVKEFTEDQEQLALEFEAKLKKEAEEEAERVRKAEEERQNKLKEKDKRLSELNKNAIEVYKSLRNFYNDVSQYEKDYRVRLFYDQNDIDGESKLTEIKNSIDFTHDGIMNNFIKALDFINFIR